jgi:hypothetical protein
MSPSEKTSSRATRFGVALPGALAGVLLIGVVAFGATAPSVFRPEPSADPAASAQKPIERSEPKADPELPPPSKPSTKPNTKPDAGAVDPSEVTVPVEDPKLFPRTPAEPAATEKPAPEPKPNPDPEKKPDPTAKPVSTTKPAPAPVPSGTLVLEGWAKEGKAKLAWKPYGGEGFEYYKLVRSADASVSWPAGADDVVVAAIGDVAATWWADAPPCGSAWTYRVFAVRHGNAGYVTLAASNAVTLKPACPEPAPKPGGDCNLAFEVRAKEGVGIKLGWTPCKHEAFAAYKLVRSMTNAEPGYPLAADVELVTATGDRFATTFLDQAVSPGQVWTYRVVAVRNDGGTLTLLAASAALSVTAK